MKNISISDRLFSESLLFIVKSYQAIEFSVLCCGRCFLAGTLTAVFVFLLLTGFQPPVIAVSYTGYSRP
jgi:hypothetical protein